MTCIVHNVPGRLRVKTPLVKGSQDNAQQINEFLSGIDGVQTVRTNSTTGSVIVHYDPDQTESWQILETLKENGYADKFASIPIAQGGRSGSAKVEEVIGRVLFGWALGKLLEGSRLSLLAALI